MFGKKNKDKEKSKKKNAVPEPDIKESSGSAANDNDPKKKKQLDESVFEWKEQYCIQVDDIDKAHMKLFSIVRRLLKNLYEGDYEKNKKTCLEAIKYLKQYTVEHFAEEEEFQRLIGYSGYETHKRIHDDMREITIPALERQMVRTNFSEESVEHFVGVCAAWLTTHIMFEDQAIISKVKSRWERHIDSDTMKILKEHAETFLAKIFQIKPEIENMNYGAYDIGESFRYFMIYKGRNNDLYRTVLILNRAFVIDTLGKLMGKQISTLGEVAVAMMRELSQTFVEDFVMKYTNDSLVLVGDGFVDKDVMKSEFDKFHPDISILWNTTCGHFAFCLKTINQVKSEAETA